MKRFIEGENRSQNTLFPERLGTLKSWMGSTHFQMKTIKRISAEMSLHVLAYNLKRVMKILGPVELMKAMQA